MVSGSTTNQSEEIEVIAEGCLAWLQRTKDDGDGPLAYLRESDREDLLSKLAKPDASDKTRLAFLQKIMTYFPIFLRWLREQGKLKQSEGK